MFFHITGAFAEFEREMIRSRVNAGLDRLIMPVSVAGASMPVDSGRTAVRSANG